MPAFAMPEDAVAALGRLAAHAAWARRPPGSVPVLAGVDAKAAENLVSESLRSNPEGGWLSGARTWELLRAYGIPMVESREVEGAPAAAEAARAIGGPVALKAFGPALLHKSDVGGVRLGLASPDAVGTAYAEMKGRLGDAMTGAVVQPMASTGVEMIVGVVHDAPFGPLVMLGLGGTAAELLGDRSFRALPLTDLDAARLVRALRSSPLLFGYRGAPPCNTGALEDLLLRVARLAEDVPELVELDLNPIIVSATGVAAVDGRARLSPTGATPEIRALRPPGP